MEIGDILAGIEHVPLSGGNMQIDISAVEFSSRDVEPGALFFCVPGTAADGHDFAADAVSRGAAALVVERELELDVPQFCVPCAREALALASANFYGNPSQRLSVVGITGTNGKTTTAFLTEHMARSVGCRTGLMGTVECHIDGEVVPSLHTTPESRDFQKLLSEMVDASVDVCACEISSHALDLSRTLGTRFAVAAFTNITQDHLDYHKTMEAYFEAKSKLFTDYMPGACVICTDGAQGRELAQRCRSLGRKVIAVGSGDACDVRLVEACYEPHSTKVTLDVAGNKVSFTYPLVGRFNIENMLVCFGIGCALGYETDAIVLALETAPQIPGRLERVIGAKGSVPPFGVLVDYAHTPDSVAKAIDAVKAVTRGRVICVFGCGGDRDHGKRPKMGAAALSADYAIVTSDNPRTEKQSDITLQILEGMKGHEDAYKVIEDRAEAIETALKMARPDDAVLIAGKGHEDYQIIGTTKHPFDDRVVASQAIERL